MAKKTRRILTICLALVLCLSITAQHVNAANDKTMMFANGAPFAGQGITVTVDGASYYFAPSGNKWVRETPIPEMNIPYGDGKYVTVTVGDDVYSAYMINHSNGNNDDDLNGTDNYDLVDIVLISEEPEPETTEPETTEPETTEPETTEPETTEPETTEPETTEPETTVPETTVPETTVPETTVPETTVPETTVPETTIPEPTIPDEPVVPVVISEDEEIPDDPDIPDEPVVPAVISEDEDLPDDPEIPDEEVPLADVPETGDISILWAAMSVMSAGGIVAVNRKKTKKEENE